MSQFKVDFLRNGVKHQPAYVKSIQSAMKRAQSKGWYGDEGGGCWDMCPTKVHVYQSVDGIYELVAIVERNKVTAVDANERRSVHVAKMRVERSQLEIREAEALAEIINRIAKGEDNDSQ